MTHVFVAVTAHGYGHLAQVAPVVAALARRRSGLRVTLQGTIDPTFAASRMPPGFRQLSIAADVALPMDSPLRVRWAEGLALFHAFEADYEAHLAAQCARFAADPPDLVLADIPWLPLDAARRCGIPAVGLCSLSWYDILREGPLGGQLSPALATRMRMAYAGADLFLRPAPTMPMAWLPNARDLSPIAVRHRRDPSGLRVRLGVPAATRLVLMLFGGAGQLRLGGGPRLLADLCLLTPDAQAASGRDDTRVLGPELPPLPEVLASCDAIITKPGYGTFAEAACHGVPVLSVAREEWPEEPWLVDWLARQVPLRTVTAAQLAAGEIATPLAALLAAGPATPVAATGADEAADLISALLAG